MMSATNGNQPCDKSDKSTVCDYNDFRRPRYFHGKLLDDKDFRAEQNYHAGKRRLLNRTLHGSGVICGLDLTWKKGASWLEVSPGVALDHEGNEIWVETPERVDISKLLPPADAAGKQPDCPPPVSNTPNRYYVAICYKEAGTDPVPVYLPGSSCDNRSCEYSADKEGYCIKLVSECPQCKQDSGLLKNLCQAGDCPPDEKPASDCANCAGLQDKALCRCYVLEEFCEKSPACPDMGPCGQSRCVILGRIDLDTKGTVLDVCINECREYVISGRFVKYLISSTLGGVGEILKLGNANKTPLIDGADIARNPIQALCWLLRYFVIETNHVEGCPDLFGTAAAGAQFSRKEFDALRAQVQTEDTTAQKTVTRVDTLEMVQTAIQAVPAQVEAQRKLIETLNTQVVALQKAATDAQAIGVRVAAVETKITAIEQQAPVLDSLQTRIAKLEKKSPQA